ncbi:dienelactone hydrolase family-domain-containing protein [Pelagophyceae sp. CCMP2097]|nr:dienelactone hydrolase family-domain-containing protein [Pelagophyceae sp. CCMP2097]
MSATDGKDCHGRAAPAPRFDAAALVRQLEFRADCQSDSRLIETTVTLEGEYEGLLVHAGGVKPLVLVVHNFQGRKRFDDDVARFFALKGFAALAIDLYPKAHALRGPTDRVACFAEMNNLLRDKHLLRGLLEKWLTLGRAQTCTDGRAAMIGFCLGGLCCFEALRCGLDLDAVVSFHGVLQADPLPLFGFDTPTEDFGDKVTKPPDTFAFALKTKVLVEHGEADSYITLAAFQQWKAELDLHSVDWQWHSHARTQHGFALGPDICRAYDALADARSTQAMLSFFSECWPDVEQHYVRLNACGTIVGHERSGRTFVKSIAPSARVLAIVGCPVDVTRTPLIFPQVLRELGTQDVVLVPLDVTPDALGPALQSLKRVRNFGGFVVTKPHKETAVLLCDALTEEAQAIGAVNAVRCRDGVLIGANFDGRGFVQGLVEHSSLGAEALPRARFLLLGAGGAARAIAFELRKRGAAVAVFNRTLGRAQRLAADLDPGISVLEALPNTLEAFDCVVQCTPLGHGEGDAMPVDAKLLSPPLLCAEIIMNPSKTRFLRAAHFRKCECVEGRHMLDAQVRLIAAFLTDTPRP